MARSALNIQEVFPHEVEVLQAAQANVENIQQLEIDDLRENFSAVVTEYQKLLRLTAKLTSLGDSNASKMERMQDELILARDVAEQANRSKSVFLASMSHELRTPLNAILGFSQILNNAADMPERYRGFLNIMYKSGEHLLHMINDILDLSKIEAGHMEVHHKPVRLRAFMDDIHRMFLLKAQEKNLEFRVEEGDTYPPVIKLDEDKLRQILINLIGNAIKFTSKGRVIVRFGAVSGNVIRFEVIDTGSGISEVSQKKLFQPFMQGNSGFQDGTGLGLAITRKLVDLIGGSISFVSEEGSGSVFRVALPFEVTDEAETEPEIKPAFRKLGGIVAPQTPTILVVDDVATNRALLSAYLEESGMFCLEASSGKEALRVAEKVKPDLVLMDIQMPEMDGIETMRKLRLLKDLEKIPIIAVAASGSPNAREELLATGFNAFIRKPFQQMELIEAIEKVTDWTFKDAQEPEHQDNAGTEQEKILREFDTLDAALKEAIVSAVEIGDLQEAFHVASKLPAESGLRQLIEKAHQTSNVSLLLGLDELINV
jgi:signal transduction histidine kinase/FixJ family two-component response regulator